MNTEFQTGKDNVNVINQLQYQFNSNNVSWKTTGTFKNTNKMKHLISALLESPSVLLILL